MDDNAVSDSRQTVDKMAAIERYLRRGWALVPLHYITSAGLCSCGNPDCRSAGKHPVGNAWQHNVYRMTDPLPWDGHPQFNIGIATGTPSGFWVLDWDPSNPMAGNDGMALTQRLPQAQVRTGGDGRHWRFEMPADFEVTNRRGSLPPGLDVRGTGGQVVAPPSVSSKGAYVELPTPGDGAPYVPPGWLLDMIRPAPQPTPEGAARTAPAGWSPVPSAGDDRGQRYARAAVDDMLAELAATPHNRNDLAWRTACRIIEFDNAGWLSEVPAVVGAWNLVTLAHPLGIVVPQSEADGIWRSAMRHVGSRLAELPPEWTDPLRIEVWPAPPMDAAGVPPFSVPSPNGASAYQVPGFSEPGTTSPSPNGAHPSPASGPPPSGAASAPPELRFDPLTEVKINEQMRLLVAREQAAERLRQMRGGDRGARLATLRSRLLNADQLDAVPPLVPLVDGMLYLDSLARINGLPGQGKSFMALDIGACVATGREWHGRAVRRAPVVYMVAEGLSGVRARKLAWEKRYGPVGPDLRFYAGAEQIAGEDWELFTALCVEVGAGLVVVDTQARATAGRNENLPSDMGPVVAGLDALRVATGACALLIHHKSKNGEGGRGTNAVEGAMQSEFDVSKSGSTVTLRTTRQKDSEASLRLALTLAPTGDSAVLVLPGESGTENMSPIEIGRMRQRALWNFMYQFCNDGDGLSRARIESGMKSDPALTLSPKEYPKAFQRAWNGLIKLGLVTKHYRRDVFKVVELQDQGADGVLTPNGTKDGADRWEPSGDWILWTADRESVTKTDDNAR